MAQYRMELAYWTWKLGLRLLNHEILRTRTAYMAYALNKWSCLEEKMRLIPLFAPDGHLQACRKPLSRDGVIEGRDLGNWCYSTLLKMLSHHFDPRRHPYNQIVNTWNDELNGDIVEAILGLVPFLHEPASSMINLRFPYLRREIFAHIRHFSRGSSPCSPAPKQPCCAISGGRRGSSSCPRSPVPKPIVTVPLHSTTNARRLRAPLHSLCVVHSTTNARRLRGSASFQAASTASTGCAILASTVAADDARGRAIDRLVATYQQSACGNGTSVQVAALSFMSFFDPPSMRFVRRRVDSSRFDNSTGLCSKLIPSYSSLLGRQMALFKDFLTSPPASPLIRSTLMSLHVIHCSHVVSALY